MSLASVIAAMTAAGCTAEQIGSVVKAITPARPRNKPAGQSPLEILKTILSNKTAQAVIDHRKAKKAPLTPRAAELLVAAFRDSGVPEKAADTMIEHGWRGFRSEWLRSTSTFTNGRGRSNGNEGFVQGVLDDIERRRHEEGAAQNVPMLFRDRERH